MDMAKCLQRVHIWAGRTDNTQVSNDKIWQLVLSTHGWRARGWTWEAPVELQQHPGPTGDQVNGNPVNGDSECSQGYIQNQESLGGSGVVTSDFDRKAGKSATRCTCPGTSELGGGRRAWGQGSAKL